MIGLFRQVDNKTIGGYIIQRKDYKYRNLNNKFVESLSKITKLIGERLKKGENHGSMYNMRGKPSAWRN